MRLALALIRAYQRHLTRYTPPCTLTPSCSQYALDAITAHGLRRGLDLIYARVAGTHPSPPKA